MRLSRVRDVAGRFHMSVQTFHRWHSDGRFPQLFTKLGHLLFVKEAELDKLLKKKAWKPKDGTLLTGATRGKSRKSDKPQESKQ